MGPAQRLVVGLAHGDGEGADEVEMLPGPEPAPGDQRLGRKRCAGDHVGFGDGRLEIVGDPGRETDLGEAGSEAPAPSGRWFQTAISS